MSIPLTIKIPEREAADVFHRFSGFRPREYKHQLMLLNVQKETEAKFYQMKLENKGMYLELSTQLLL